MKITSLLENTTTRDDMLTEHGLNLYIETKKHNILFDMGQTEAFYKNAKTLGVDLFDVDIAVLSHGHYDHGGGLKKFLEINKKAPIYLSHYAFEPHYNGMKKYIGLDIALMDNDRLNYTDNITVIDEGLTLYSCNENKHDYDLGSFGLKVVEDEKFVPDDFRHEHYLLVEEDDKRVLISGCSHKGIIDITQWFKPDVLIGGFHFSRLSLDKELENYARLLNEFNTVYYTCHCTGEKQFTFMKNYMTRLNYLSCGQSIKI